MQVCGFAGFKQVVATPTAFGKREKVSNFARYFRSSFSSITAKAPERKPLKHW